MSGENSEDIEFLKLTLEEGNLWEILEIAQSCGVLEPGLEERVKRAVRHHKEELVGYLSDLCSTQRRSCRAGLALSYGVLGLIENFEEVYGLEEKVEISRRKGILLRRIKKNNFKNPPEGLGLGLVPRGLTAEQDGSFANDYMVKVQRELVPEIQKLGLGEEQVGYVMERTQELSQKLPKLQY